MKEGGEAERRRESERDLGFGGCLFAGGPAVRQYET